LKAHRHLGKSRLDGGPAVGHQPNLGRQWLKVHRRLVLAPRGPSAVCPRASAPVA